MRPMYCALLALATLIVVILAYRKLAKSADPCAGYLGNARRVCSAAYPQCGGGSICQSALKTCMGIVGPVANAANDTARTQAVLANLPAISACAQVQADLTSAAYDSIKASMGP